MKRPRPQPPSGAPKGTVWFGGPIDRCSVALRVYADDLDPTEVSNLLRVDPTDAEQKGARASVVPGETRRFPPTGRWIFEISDKGCAEWDLEEVVRCLLAKLPSEITVWRKLHERYRIDLFCSIQIEASNRGFGLSPEVSRLLAERELEIGFDIYAPDQEVE